jgi:hypothetical protein
LTAVTELAGVGRWAEPGDDWSGIWPHIRTPSDSCLKMTAPIHYTPRFSMEPSLRFFTNQYLSVVIASLAPVILVAFLSIPFTLGGHPGDVRTADASVSQHMT